MELAGPLGTPLVYPYSGAEEASFHTLHLHRCLVQGPITSLLDVRARGEGERVMALESWERTRASRGIEEGHSRSFYAVFRTYTLSFV